MSEDYDTYQVQQVRSINECAPILANLEKRKALRDKPHARGWMTRRGRVE